MKRKALLKILPLVIACLAARPALAAGFSQLFIADEDMLSIVCQNKFSGATRALRKAAALKTGCQVTLVLEGYERSTGLTKRVNGDVTGASGVLFQGTFAQLSVAANFDRFGLEGLHLVGVKPGRADLFEDTSGYCAISTSQFTNTSTFNLMKTPYSSSFRTLLFTIKAVNRYRCIRS